MSPDVGEEDWVPLDDRLDDRLARIPELVEKLRQAQSQWQDTPHDDNCHVWERGPCTCAHREPQGFSGDAADALEAAQARIIDLEAAVSAYREERDEANAAIEYWRKDVIRPLENRIDTLTEELRGAELVTQDWREATKRAEQRAERYRVALEKIDRFDMRGFTRPDSLAFQMQRIAMHALAPDPARPAAEPDDLTPAELSAAARRLLRMAAAQEQAADEPQEPDA